MRFFPEVFWAEGTGKFALSKEMQELSILGPKPSHFLSRGFWKWKKKGRDPGYVSDLVFLSSKSTSKNPGRGLARKRFDGQKTRPSVESLLLARQNLANRGSLYIYFLGGASRPTADHQQLVTI